MSDDEDLDRRKRKAGKARFELEVTEAAFAQMRQSAIDAWLGSKDSETEFREGLHRAVKIIDIVREKLFHAVQDGKVADATQAIRDLHNQTADNR